MLELFSTVKFLVFSSYPSVSALYILVLIYCSGHMRPNDRHLHWTKELLSNFAFVVFVRSQ